MDEGPFAIRFADLPVVLPIFPLSGALLLPHGRLPLNIFEPRYLNMTLDALGHGRMIGMIQPTDPDAAEPVPVYPTGCAGRISSFAETDDGRLQITLTGVCRFRINSEIESVRGYRRVIADYAPFAGDLEAPDDDDEGIDRERLLAALRPYFRLREMKVNWEVIEDAPATALVTSLAMLCPFATAEKQALLEAPSLRRRAEVMTSLMEMAVFDQGSRGTARQ